MCVVIICLWAALGITTYSTAFQVEDTALILPLSGTLQPVFRTFLTQGWAFFTRSPREQDLFIFGQDDASNWRSISHGPPSRIRNVFGLRRLPRAESVEIGLLSHSIPGSAWAECLDSVTLCLESLDSMSIENKSHRPIICGEVGLVLAEPIPWAWRHLSERFEMPAAAVKLDIIC